MIALGFQLPGCAGESKDTMGSNLHASGIRNDARVFVLLSTLKLVSKVPG